MKEITASLIEHTKALLLGAKKNYLAASVGVYKLYEGWTDSPDTWVEFYEQELELSKSQVSKMRTVGKFIETKGLSLETDVGYEKLYLSITRNPEAKTEYIVAEAQTWSPQDHKDAKKDECKEPDYHTVCVNCWATKDKHA